MTTSTPIASVVEQAAVNLLGKFAEFDDWDMPPSIGMIIDDDSGDTPKTVPLETPDELWTAASPDVILTMLAGAVRGGIMRLGSNSDQVTAPKIIGVLIVVESWTVNTYGWTEQERIELEKWAAHNDLKDHPTGQVRECRNIVVIDSSGVIAFGEQMRGGRPDEHLHSALPGSIPTALRTLMDAIRETTNSVMTVDTDHM